MRTKDFRSKFYSFICNKCTIIIINSIRGVDLINKYNEHAGTMVGVSTNVTFLKMAGATLSLS